MQPTGLIWGFVLTWNGEGYCNRLCFHNVRASGLNARRYVEELEDKGNGEV